MAEHRTDMPFVAPCRKLVWSAPFHWMKLGWQDFNAARSRSLAYGLLIVILSWVVSSSAYGQGCCWHC